MICGRCLRRASALRTQLSFPRSFSSTRLLREPTTASPPTDGKPAATPSSHAPSFSNPLSNDASLGASSRPKPKATAIPVSSAPAGTPLTGLNYFKGRPDIVALPEEEYPEWLWRCLDAKKTDGAEGEGVGDEFSKSKKLRRKAAKAQRKLEARLIASGDTSSLIPKIPIQQQSIDLPSNEEGSLEGGLKAVEKREELRQAMRRERRAKIKEANFLKSM